MRDKVGWFLAMVLLGSALVVAPAGAAPIAAEEHCATRVLAKRDSGELVLSPTVCRSTQTAALQAIGAVSVTGMSAQADFTIGVHYDGAGLSGSSITVVGDDCNGGWVNLSSSWDNRISSTQNGCPTVRHYDLDNATGSSQSTTGGGGNLTTLNNRANSIKYS